MLSRMLPRTLGVSTRAALPPAKLVKAALQSMQHTNVLLGYSTTQHSFHLTTIAGSSSSRTGVVQVHVPRASFAASTSNPKNTGKKSSGESTSPVPEGENPLTYHQGHSVRRLPEASLSDIIEMGNRVRQIKLPNVKGGPENMFQTGVYVDYFPFNILYKHSNTHVLAYDPEDRGDRPSRALALIFSIFLAVWLLWAQSRPGSQYTEDLSSTLSNLRWWRHMYDRIQTPADEAKWIGAMETLANPEIVRVYKERYEFMYNNFTSNLKNFRDNPWSIITANFSHYYMAPMVKNMLLLSIFAPKLYSFLGPRAFAGFFLLSGLGSTSAHLIDNALDKRHWVFPASTLFDREVALPATTNRYDRTISKTRHSDKIAMGAMGATAGILISAAMLFPVDRFNFRIIKVPLPLMVGVVLIVDGYMFRVGHDANFAPTGHIGGVLVGALATAALWYLPFGRKRILTPFKRFKSHMPIMAERQWLIRSWTK